MAHPGLPGCTARPCAASRVMVWASCGASKSALTRPPHDGSPVFNHLPINTGAYQSNTGASQYNTRASQSNTGTFQSNTGTFHSNTGTPNQTVRCSFDQVQSLHEAGDEEEEEESPPTSPMPK